MFNFSPLVLGGEDASSPLVLSVEDRGAVVGILPTNSGPNFRSKTLIIFAMDSSKVSDF